jgi:hypothetical protein
MGVWRRENKAKSENVNVCRDEFSHIAHRQQLITDKPTKAQVEREFSVSRQARSKAFLAVTASVTFGPARGLSERKTSRSSSRK